MEEYEEVCGLGGWQPRASVGCHFLHKIGTQVSCSKSRGKESGLVFDRGETEMVLVGGLIR